MLREGLQCVCFYIHAVNSALHGVVLVTRATLSETALCFSWGIRLRHVGFRVIGSLAAQRETRRDSACQPVLQPADKQITQLRTCQLTEICVDCEQNVSWLRVHAPVISFGKPFKTGFIVYRHTSYTPTLKDPTIHCHRYQTLLLDVISSRLPPPSIIATCLRNICLYVN